MVSLQRFDIASGTWMYAEASEGRSANRFGSVDDEERMLKVVKDEDYNKLTSESLMRLCSIAAEMRKERQHYTNNE